MKRRLLCAALLVLALGLCACAAAPEPSPEATEPAAAPTPAPTPEPTPAPLVFPDGSLHSPMEETLDLSEAAIEQLRSLPPLLRRMEGLRRVELGERTDLSLTELKRLEESCPGAEVACRFSLYGQSVSTLDEELNLSHVPVSDRGEQAALALSCMPRCALLDMDSCGVESGDMARIRDEFPEVKVVWRIWFGTNSSVRTDVERIMASLPEDRLCAENTRDLRYCTQVRLLDIGHAEGLYDYSFLSCMPKLEVAILGISGLRDLSPLANCENLEYLEINSCAVRDLSPLAKLKNLKHLNICWLGQVRGWEALCDLKQLERLWIGPYTQFPEGALETVLTSLPDTEIDLKEKSGCGGSWRYIPGVGKQPRYALLREQFDYDHYNTVCSARYNDPLY